MATIKDVAARASVSPGTVSNALTGKRPVSSDTRRRIVAAIEELGYQPNVLARSLVNRRSDTLAVVAAGLEYYGPSRTLVGIDSAAHRLGYSVLLTLLHAPDDEAVDGAIAALAGRRVDGIIWAVPEVGGNRTWLQRHCLDRLPPISFLTMGPQPGLSVVAVDNRVGASLVAEHLLAQGRRRLGIISGPPAWWEARERAAGFDGVIGQVSGLQALARAEGDWTAASGDAALARLLERQPDLDAVFAANDQMALGALQAAHRLGLRVPDDLAVAGFDDTPESSFYWPPLTTVHQDLIEAGEVAVREVQNMIVSRQQGLPPVEPAAVVLAPRLVVRQSSGGPHQSPRDDAGDGV